MKKVVATAKTIDDAVQKALEELSVPREKVSVRILEEPSRGLFGLIGSRDAKVEVEVQFDPVDQGLAFLQDVLANMNVDARVEMRRGEEGMLFDIQGANLGIIIGRRGQTLDSLQYLVNVVANRHADKHVRIVLDAENYRQRRKETLEQLAERVSRKALAMKRSVRLEPMSAAERKVIHSFLQKRTDVVTYSEGEEPNRYIVIAPKEASS
ncbi:MULTISPECIES: RNA-binding cell elongation regulator Jag/EloR [Brevibacillus]|uniref:RNA-binding protein KhpB n=2 Tax=Bacillati TaxID=1783272 RepID=M8E075_9BACL|nr:RNA-binding cell elongation regulator Jag/EloR [Brevibacillus borstelensis]EMT52691.1 Jag protein [Brevibacillus borstelensis AK1]KKX55038.1 DNA-binding protein [Brevibacillus borstelensis cifa_chp40]MBE5393822.1 protein jag [Brevibacillus borstelensis]MCC0566726.1 protein jag [Brevibacillus borstelensis]MCM3473168.1 protein jag [Brevibacillus borstelensis]